MKTILIIDDEADICLLLGNFFKKKGYHTATAQTGEEGIAWLRDNSADLVLCDFKLPDYSGLEILQKIKILSPKAQVVIITGYSDVKMAVQVLKKGAFDYVTKPLFPDEILSTVESALQSSNDIQRPRPSKSNNKASTSAKNKNFVVGESPQSQSVLKHISLIAPTDMSVIVLGETGTGKEYVARAIHEKSVRSSKPFVAIDCGALPGELAGSELFGHVKGAFTGALQDKKGCFEMADGGTLFLDEIGNLTYENQVKLLRVIQERQVRRLGASSTTPVDVRIIVATNENLREEVANGQFREDLYHRLNEFQIQLSPLRDRLKDIMVFAEYFLAQSNDQLGKEIKGFDDEVKEVLSGYYWHGNLRELKNVVKRAVLLSEGQLVSKQSLPPEIVSPIIASEEAIEISFNGTPKSLKEVAEEAEKQAIINALERTDNNKSKTAELLQVDRKTLYNKINNYGIDL